MCRIKLALSGPEYTQPEQKSLSGIKRQAFADRESANSPCEVARLSVCYNTHVVQPGRVRSANLCCLGSPARVPGSQGTHNHFAPEEPIHNQ